MHLMLLPTARYRGGYFPVSKPIQLVEQLAIRCSKGATRQARLDGFGYTRIIGLTSQSVSQKGSFSIREAPKDYCPQSLKKPQTWNGDALAGDPQMHQC
jgi:hypothetical protein